MKATGLGGELEIVGDFVVLRPKGFLGALTHGLAQERKIEIRNISEVQFKKPGFTNGYLRLSIRGDTRVPAENTVAFMAGEQERQFSAFRIELEAKLGAHRSASVSVADELRKLADLRSQNIITDAEFEKQKRLLLGS